MPLFKRPGTPSARPRPRPPRVGQGDRVRIAAATSPQAGQSGTVVRVRGRSVLLELDRPFASAGRMQRLYYSYPGELELVPRVGRMGAHDLFADDEDDAYSPAGNL